MEWNKFIRIVKRKSYYGLFIFIFAWIFLGVTLRLDMPKPNSNKTMEHIDIEISKNRNTRMVDIDSLSSRKGLVKRIIGSIQPQRIRSNLMHISSNQHLAGTPEEDDLGNWIARKWTKKGMDKVEKTPYDVLLSYPSTSPEKRNRVEIFAEGEDGEKHVIYVSQLEDDSEYMMLPDSTYNPAYNAYAKAGIVEGDLVYANYGKNEDFKHLHELNITVKGKIVIARYGHGFRGEKADFAARYGAIGLILYSEPTFWRYEEEVYPDGPFRPNTGVERGTLLGDSGDPQTPGYPSLKSAYRVPEDQLQMPKIPVHPIGIEDAEILMSNMSGISAFRTWKGELNIDYHLGPGFINKTLKVRLCVYNKNKVRTVFNVIGTIYGREEPDRYILMGSHRDAWTYGAIDPGSSNAIMMEVANTYLALLKDGWRPRRTIKFCSWAAEEFGLIGSWEWVEQYAKILQTRAVVYLNLDIIMRGNYTISLSGSPSMKRVLWNTAKAIPDPDIGGKSMYDTWNNRQFNYFKENGKPGITSLGAGSDFSSFIAYLGIPSMQSVYNPDLLLYMFQGSYPLYHTLYDTFHVVESHIDPDFSHHQAMGQFYGVLTFNLANSHVIPFNCRDYAVDVWKHFVQLNDTSGKTLLANDVSLKHLKMAIEDLMHTAKRFHQRIRYTNKRDKYQLRAVNDQLIYFERAFIDHLGLPGRPFVRHVIYAHNKLDRYASAKFPGIFDALYDIESNPDPEKWEIVKKQVAAVTYAVRSAITVLEPNH